MSHHTTWFIYFFFCLWISISLFSSLFHHHVSTRSSLFLCIVSDAGHYLLYNNEKLYYSLVCGIQYGRVNSIRRSRREISLQRKPVKAESMPATLCARQCPNCLLIYRVEREILKNHTFVGLATSLFIRLTNYSNDEFSSMYVYLSGFLFIWAFCNLSKIYQKAIQVKKLTFKRLWRS